MLHAQLHTPFTILEPLRHAKLPDGVGVRGASACPQGVQGYPCGGGADAGLPLSHVHGCKGIINLAYIINHMTRVCVSDFLPYRLFGGSGMVMPPDAFKDVCECTGVNPGKITAIVTDRGGHATFIDRDAKHWVIESV